MGRQVNYIMDYDPFLELARSEQLTKVYEKLARKARKLAIQIL